jgi:acetylornithine deacetylase/succinyl-diaminopimelate desuccinylase-like protein
MLNKFLASALAWLKANHSEIFRGFAELVEVPSISTDGKHQTDVGRCADLTCHQMRRAGLENVSSLQVGQSNPYSYGEWLGSPGSPTLFLYAHQDVQPADPKDGWTSSPWKLASRNGRFYGRGTADDKGAIVAQLAVVSAYLKSAGTLPVNVKMLVESEEEIGSPNLTAFFKKHQKRIQSDVIIVCDTENLAQGLPSITYSLRGIVQALVEVKTAARAVHSGIGGGFVPDAALALNVLLSRFYQGDRRPGLPTLERSVLPLSRPQRQALQTLPGNEKTWRKDFSLLDGVRLANTPRSHPYEQIWHRPAVTIIAQEASSIQGRSDQILPKASAVVSYRTVPNQNPEEVFSAIQDLLKTKPPWNAVVTVTSLGSVDWWTTDPSGATFDAARSALRSGFGKEPTLIGSGGSIGFIKPLADLFHGAPALLLGIGDPRSNPHAPNESLP